MQSSNGFWYTYIHRVKENLPTPEKGNEVIIAYNITDLNNSVLYSKEDLGIKKYIIDKEDFISEASGIFKNVILAKDLKTFKI